MKKRCSAIASRVTKRLLRLLAVGAALLTAFSAGAQEGFPDSLRAGGPTVREAVFVHTDRTVYLAGETLWFKAYVVDAGTHRPLDLSKVLYAELLDEQGRPALQAMIELDRGGGDGSFVLPPSLRSGVYLLRAYTAWMKNFGAARFFQIPVQVVNTARRPDWAALEQKRTPVIRFFPEGGVMVEGLETRLGFQLTGEDGLGLDGEGVLLENEKDTVARFRPLRFGLGNLVFTPRKGAVYRAVVRTAGGDTVSAPPGAIEKEGTVLRVGPSGAGQLAVRAFTTAAGEGQVLYLLAQNGGRILYASAKVVAGGQASWLIADSTLAEGVTRFTLFDAGRHPVAERLTFRRPVRSLVIAGTTDAAVYPKRSRVRLALQTSTEGGEGVGGTLSVSVVRLDSLQGTDPVSIGEWLWLLSELRGPVESPASYFPARGPEADEALDNLLLMHGWRRIGGEAPVRGFLPAGGVLPDYEGPVIRGRVVNKNTGEPVAGVLCYLSAPGERFYAGNAVSDAKGELRFIAHKLYGAVDLVAQTARADSTLRIDLLSPFDEGQPGFSLPRFVLPERWKGALQSRHLDLQVANQVVPPAMQAFSVPRWGDTTLFYGRPDNRYYLDEYTRFPTLEEVMREVVAETWLQKDRDSFHFRVLNLPYRAHFDADPLVLLDGVPVFNTNKLLLFDPLKVKRIDVLARHYFWGNTVNSGILSFATYEGNLSNFEPDPGVELLAYNGLQVKREFYSPLYATPEAVQSRMPDRRRVLLWQPAVVTDAGSRQEVPFYTSDVAGRYAVHVEGVGADGRVGSRWLVIDVK